MGVFVALDGVFCVNFVFLCITAGAGIVEDSAVKRDGQLGIGAGGENVADDGAVVVLAPRADGQGHRGFVRDLLPVCEIDFDLDLLIAALLIAHEEGEGIAAAVGVCGGQLELVLPGAAAVVEQLHGAGIGRSADGAGERLELAASALEEGQGVERDAGGVLAGNGKGERKLRVGQLVGEDDLRHGRAAVFTGDGLLRPRAVLQRRIAQLGTDVAGIGDGHGEGDGLAGGQCGGGLNGIGRRACAGRDGKDRAAAFLHALTDAGASQLGGGQLCLHRALAGQGEIVLEQTVDELILLDLGGGASVFGTGDLLGGDAAAVPSQLEGKILVALVIKVERKAHDALFATLIDLGGRFQRITFGFAAVGDGERECAARFIERAGGAVRRGIGRRFDRRILRAQAGQGEGVAECAVFQLAAADRLAGGAVGRGGQRAGRAVSQPAEVKAQVKAVLVADDEGEARFKLAGLAGLVGTGHGRVGLKDIALRRAVRGLHGDAAGVGDLLFPAGLRQDNFIYHGVHPLGTGKGDLVVESAVFQLGGQDLFSHAVIRRAGNGARSASVFIPGQDSRQIERGFLLAVGAGIAVLGGVVRGLRAVCRADLGVGVVRFGCVLPALGRLGAAVRF